MHFNHNDLRYRVRFMYESGNKKDGYLWGGQALSNIHKKRIKTICEIGVKDENGEWRGLAGAYVVRDPRDPFTKGAGRRAALTRALNQISDRGLRRTIWDEYFAAHKDAGWMTQDVA